MARNTIIIKGSNMGDRYEEALAAAAGIYPGHILEYDSAGKLKNHATAGGDVTPVVVAIEDDLQGKGVADVYTSGQKVFTYIPRAGDRVQLRAANGQNVAIGNKLCSDGAGKVNVYTAPVDESAEITTIYTKAIVAIAMEAKDMSGSSAADPASDLFEAMIV